MNKFLSMTVALGIIFGTSATAQPINPTTTTYSAAQPANLEATTRDAPSPHSPAANTTQTSSTTNKPSTILLQGQINYVIPSGTPIKLKIASVPTTGMRLAERDLDGNLPPARLGQEITARTTEDLYVDDNKVIPEGTIFHGYVSKILPPRRVSRPGSLVIRFDQIRTPDGRRFAFAAEADNYRPSTPKSKSKGLGIIAAHTAGGAIVGALVAYELFGLQNTIALHGYNIAGGAALGALAATVYAIAKHGPAAVLEPGDDLNMEIDNDLLLPAASQPTAKAPTPHLEGLEIKIFKSKVVSDGLDGHQLSLDTLITNDTDLRLSSIDLYLEDDNGCRCPLAAGLEDDSEVNFEISPHSMRHVCFSFQLEYPKLKRKLIWYQHATHKPLLTQRLP